MISRPLEIKAMLHHRIGISAAAELKMLFTGANDVATDLLPDDRRPTSAHRGLHQAFYIPIGNPVNTYPGFLV
jgi:hypothetical protein